MAIIRRATQSAWQFHQISPKGKTLMSTPGLQDLRILVHQILTRSHHLLKRVSTNTPAPFADILHTATEKICNQHASHVSPHHAAWLEAEAAS
ncbi:hypothetical protein AB4Z54_48730, partial [Streptomyces sp. MCAF7]